MREKKYEYILDALGSVMVPGLGQFMQSRWIEGVFFFTTAALGYLLYAPFGLPFHLWSIFAAGFPKHIRGVLRAKYEKFRGN